MSLLLDALKKAAMDKQGASALDPQVVDDSDAELTLTLDDDGVHETPGENVASTPGQNSAHTTAHTVSEEALQMLVFKTNREHRRRQRLIWGGIALTSIVILLLGGYYFYDSMVRDVESLQRTHKIAIQKVNAEVVRAKRPELIADLTDSETQPSQHHKHAENRNTDERKGNEKPAAPAAQPAHKSRDAANSTTSWENNKPSFVRTVQRDPVAESLQQGWQAFKAGDYAAASRHYASAMSQEPNNRDALLGLAAIAIKQQDHARARALYSKLLQFDPRDADAIAALSSLQRDNQQAGDVASSYSQLSESRLKVLLQQQPESAPIQFALGNIKARQQQWPQAQSYYFKAWMADESNPDYAFNLAVSLDQLGKVKQAERFYRRSLQLAAVSNHSFSIDAVKQRLHSLGESR